MSTQVDSRSVLTHRLESVAVFLLLAAPIVSLCLNVLSWLRYGIDLPYLDDLRPYFFHSAGRMDMAYLFTPANDTLYPIGIFLDSLAFRFLDGNSVAYQALTLTMVMGGLLWVQYDLLKRCTGNVMVAAASFGLTLFMLQPGSYWGLQNMAYHQVLPLLCILLAVDAILARWRHTVPALLLLGCISGLTYISGAFSYLTLALALIVVHFLNRQADLLLYGLTAAVPGVLTSLAQGWVIVFVQHGTHRADTPMAYPWQADFWIFMLGKIGRAAYLPETLPYFSFWFAAGLCALLVGAFVFGAWRVRKRLDRTTIAYLLIFASVFTYLVLICAGRTNMRPENISEPIDVFLLGFSRFHFFWATVLLPWLAALLFSKVPRLAIVLAVAGLGSLLSKSYIADNSQYYQTTVQPRLDNLECLRSGLATGKAFFCEGLHPGVDMQDIYFTSRAAGASFTRLIPVQPVAFGQPDALYSSDQAPYQLFNFGDNPQLSHAHTTPDPMIFIKTGKPEAMKACRLLEVSAEISTDTPELAQLFYAPTGQGVTEQNSNHQPLSTGKNLVSFQVMSQNGFEDFLRLDPVTGARQISIGRIEARCRQ